MHTPSVAALLKEATSALQQAGKAAPRLEARQIACHVLTLTPADLILREMTRVSAHEAAAFRAIVAERIKGVPLARLFGAQDFLDFSLKLGPQTLIPRADTEILVEAVLAALKPVASAPLRLLDLGTGTGAILIALLRALPDAVGLAVDIAPQALTIACENADALGVGARFRALGSNWFEALSDDLRFDVIVSNPPYIADPVIETLEDEVRHNDPLAALSGGADGLDAYRAILKDAGRYLAPHGLIALEIGFDQEESVRALIARAGLQADPALRDLGGNPRVILASHG